jgi:hypothetical protein
MGYFCSHTFIGAISNFDCISSPRHQMADNLMLFHPSLTKELMLFYK